MAQLTRRPASAARTFPQQTRQSATPLSIPLRVGIDLALIIIGFWLAYHLRYIVGFPDDVAASDQRPFLAWSMESFLPLLVLVAAILPLLFAVRGVYQLSRWTGLLDEALLITNSTFLGFGGLIVVVFFFRTLYFSRAIFLYAFIFIVGLLLLWRVLWRVTQTMMHARGHWVDRVLVVGAGPAGERVMSALLGQPGLGYTLAGFVDDSPFDPGWAVATQRAVVRPDRLGTCSDLPEVISHHGIDEVIIALPSTAHDNLYWVIEQCRLCHVSFTLVPDLFELSLDRVQIHALNGLPLITTHDTSIHGPNAAIKRAFDLLIGGLLLGLLVVPMLIIALLVRLDSPGPILYGQRRVGRKGRPFICYKFRSMYHNAHDEYVKLKSSASYTGDNVIFKLRDDPRRTRMGRWLRSTSLDELPNLFNVIRGEMSLVGPRPHVPEEVAKYEPWHRQRLAFTPGMTCLWQVNGRSDLTFDEQVRFDLYYAERWSLWLDIKILLWTIPAVLTRRGAY